MGRTSKKFNENDALVLQNMRSRKAADEKARRERKKATEAAGLLNLYPQAQRIGLEIARRLMQLAAKQTNPDLRVSLIDGQIVLLGEIPKRQKKNLSANDQLDLFKWPNPPTKEPEA